MPIELKIPTMGESVTQVMVGDWLKAPGDPVKVDEPLVLIESDKAAVELPSPANGILGPILKETGDEVGIGEVIGSIIEGDGAPAPAVEAAPAKPSPQPPANTDTTSTPTMPSARKLLREHGLSATEVTGSGPSGQVTKDDVRRHLDAPTPSERPAPAAAIDPEAIEEVVRMTPLRRAIATRLVEAQQTMALLTTVNEIDMTAVKMLRAEHQDAFVKKHGVKLGFMSFFVRATVEALKESPAVNAEIRGTNIVYKNHYDIGIAVGGGRGLVVPVLRGAERLSFSDVEKGIAELAERAQKNKLTPDELTGGTFTISNGGVYGSLLSTPIVNPPQSAILGLHSIQDRPVALNGQVVIRPMMYVALTYDHRIIDGREAVTFLRTIKDKVENPSRILLEV